MDFRYLKKVPAKGLLYSDCELAGFAGFSDAD